MVRVSLQSLMRMTSRSQFGGKNIADKVKTDLPGLSKESLKHNWGITPLLTFFSVGAVVCGWYIYQCIHPKNLLVIERANEAEGEKMAKGFFGWWYHSNKEAKDYTPMSPNIGKK